MPSTLVWILIMTIINGLLAFVGAILYFVFKKNLSKLLIYLVAFTTGSLLGGAFLHFIPESLEKISTLPTVLLVAFGFFIFLLLEKYLHWHHCHDGECEKHPYTYLLLWGDGIHNFIDGLIIASSFLISIPFGIISSLLIIAHELPQEISDFGVLVYGGFKEREALFYNFLSQLTAVLGGLIGYFFLRSTDFSIYLLPFAAGGFIYIAIADLIPEIFKEKDVKRIFINFVIILVGFLVLLSAKLFIG